MDLMTKTLALVSRTAILIGGSCIFAYSLRINHFPQEMSLGDGFLFIFTAACFGIIHLIFIACLISLGICLSPILRKAFDVVIWAINLRRRTKISQTHTLAPFEWSSIIPAFFSVIFIVGFGRQDASAYWSLPSLAIILYLFFSVYKSSESKLKKIELVKRSLVLTEQQFDSSTSLDQDNLKRDQMFCIFSVLAIPLILGGVSGQLIEAAMRFAHIRVENPTLYIKDPYASLVPKALISVTKTTLNEYSTFIGVKVLFKGFGKTTVVSFQDGNTTRMLEIPNELIIIEDHK